MNKNFKEDKNFPTITKNNIDTWKDITYTYIIRGMLATEENVKYGEAMTKAENLTTILFKALKIKMGVNK
jgi:hypothetical protein